MQSTRNTRAHKTPVARFCSLALACIVALGSFSMPLLHAATTLRPLGTEERNVDDQIEGLLRDDTTRKPPPGSVPSVFRALRTGTSLEALGQPSTLAPDLIVLRTLTFDGRPLVLHGSQQLNPRFTQHASDATMDAIDRILAEHFPQAQDSAKPARRTPAITQAQAALDRVLEDTQRPGVAAAGVLDTLCRITYEQRGPVQVTAAHAVAPELHHTIPHADGEGSVVVVNSYGDSSDPSKIHVILTSPTRLAPAHRRAIQVFLVKQSGAHVYPDRHTTDRGELRVGAIFTQVPPGEYLIRVKVPTDTTPRKTTEHRSVASGPGVPVTADTSLAMLEDAVGRTNAELAAREAKGEPVSTIDDILRGGTHLAVGDRDADSHQQPLRLTGSQEENVEQLLATAHALVADHGRAPRQFHKTGWVESTGYPVPITFDGHTILFPLFSIATQEKGPLHDRFSWTVEQEESSPGVQLLIDAVNQRLRAHAVHEHFRSLEAEAFGEIEEATAGLPEQTWVVHADVLRNSDNPNLWLAALQAKAADSGVELVIFESVLQEGMKLPFWSGEEPYEFDEQGRPTKQYADSVPGHAHVLASLAQVAVHEGGYAEVATPEVYVDRNAEGLATEIGVSLEGEHIRGVAAYLFNFQGYVPRVGSVDAVLRRAARARVGTMLYRGATVLGKEQQSWPDQFKVVAGVSLGYAVGRRDANVVVFAPSSELEAFRRETPEGQQHDFVILDGVADPENQFRPDASAFVDVARVRRAREQGVDQKALSGLPAKVMDAPNHVLKPADSQNTASPITVWEVSPQPLPPATDSGPGREWRAAMGSA